MKIRWRQYELTLMTIVATMVLAIYLLRLRNLTTEEIEMIHKPFARDDHALSYYKNILLLQIGILAIQFASYLWISKLIIPKLFFYEKDRSIIDAIFDRRVSASDGMIWSHLGTYLLIAMQITLVIYVLGPVTNFFTYYLSQYSYHPGLLFSVFPYHPQPTSDVVGGLTSPFYVVMIFILYGLIRETVINYIENRNEKRAYWILVTNQAIVFVVIYLSFLPLLLLFSDEPFHNRPPFLVYLAIVPFFIALMCNIYVLFPLKEEGNPRFIPYLILSTFISTLPFVLFIRHEGFTEMFLTFWAIQLFIVTPLSWLFYQLRKDKITQLRGVQKAYAESKVNLDFLRSQINPHFLFNSLNTLYGTALREKSEDTAIGIQKLGDMMRFMLHENNLDFIPMSKEIDYLMNYISLQRLRTQSSPEIAIEESIDEHHCNHVITPMLLIPFVENAFKHGISLTEKSWIIIKLVCDERGIKFEIRNSIHRVTGSDIGKEKSGIGMNNVKERLNHLYPGRHTLDFSENSNEFRIELSIEL